MKPVITAALLVGMTASFAHAQGAPIEFRMAASDANIAGCRSLDAQLSRVHSVTLNGDTALLKLAGGISETLKQTAPGVYNDRLHPLRRTARRRGEFGHVSPTLVVTEKNRGCRWDATTK